MSLADKFITQNDTELVMRDFQPSVSTSPAPLRTFSLPPLGFPPLPSQQDLNTNIAVTPQQLLTAALASLPLWFLLGGLWSLLTSLSVSTLRDELSDLSFLFMPQSNSLAITKSGVDQAITELDKSLAAVFMGIKRKYGAKPEPPGLLDSLLRLMMVGLSLVSGPLQFARHLLGLVIIKLCPDCKVMEDYLAWLDNMAAGDTRAAEYLMEKTGGNTMLGGAWPGPRPSSQDFPNFYNQFEGV